MGYSERFTSKEAALFIGIQLSSQFERLQERKIPEIVDGLLVVCGHGGMTDNPLDDSIGDFEYRQEPANQQIALVEFERRIDPQTMEYVRFQQIDSDDTEAGLAVVLDSWNLPADQVETREREEKTGIHLGATAVKSCTYGGENYVDELSKIRIFMLLSKLEDGIAYDLGQQTRPEEAQTAA